MKTSMPYAVMGGMLLGVAATATAQNPTNIVLINLDDVGYGDRKACASRISWPANPSAVHHVPDFLPVATPTALALPVLPDPTPTMASTPMR